MVVTLALKAKSPTRNGGGDGVTVRPVCRCLYVPGETLCLRVTKKASISGISPFYWPIVVMSSSIASFIDLVNQEKNLAGSQLSCHKLASCNAKSLTSL